MSKGSKAHSTLRFTIGEAAYWTYSLWDTPHVPEDMRLEDIASSLSMDAEHVTDFPPYWPVELETLVKKVSSLSDRDQHDLRQRFERLKELSPYDAGRIHHILENWANAQEDEKEIEFLREKLLVLGVNVE